MTTPKYNMIPLLTTSAGSCLTAKNWQESGVNCVSYSLVSLLVKPGFAYLNALLDWPKYTGWSGDWVLNASMEAAPTERNYKFRSPYDGSRLSCSMDEIAAIILRLKPSQVILPAGFYSVGDDILCALADKTALFVPVNDHAYYPPLPTYGIYYDHDNALDVPDIVMQHPIKFPYRECYVAGPIDASHLVSNQTIFFESDSPAKDACSGKVYSHEGVIDLQDKIHATQFELIDSKCDCPTCGQKFTRAYLHHLLEHTPLLCQRLLIQHNVYYCIHRC